MVPAVQMTGKTKPRSEEEDKEQDGYTKMPRNVVDTIKVANCSAKRK